MKNSNKREIKESVAKAVSALLDELKISKPSKKTKKIVSKASKALKKELKNNVKRQSRKAAKVDPASAARQKKLEVAAA